MPVDWEEFEAADTPKESVDWTEFEPAEILPTGKPELPLPEEYKRLSPEEQAEYGKMAEQIMPARPDKAFAYTVKKAGQLLGELKDAYAFEAVREPGLQAQQLGVSPETIKKLSGEEVAETETVRTEGTRALPVPLRVLARASSGLVETAPQVAGVAALQASGVPMPVAAAAVFGSTPEGFDPKAAAIAAALPFVGKYSGEIVGALAKRLNVSTVEALNFYKQAGGMGGAAAYLATIDESEIQNLPPEERDHARIEAVAGLLGQSLLGPMGVEKETSLPKRPAPQQGPVFGRSLEMPAPGLPPRQGPPVPPPVPRSKPVVPTTAPEPQRNLTVTEEIRQAKATTVAQIQQLFPQAQLSREQARELRNKAFPDLYNKPIPQEVVQAGAVLPRAGAAAADVIQESEATRASMEQTTQTAQEAIANAEKAVGGTQTAAPMAGVDIVPPELAEPIQRRGAKMEPAKADETEKPEWKRKFEALPEDQIEDLNTELADDWDNMNSPEREQSDQLYEQADALRSKGDKASKEQADELELQAEAIKTKYADEFIQKRMESLEQAGTEAPPKTEETGVEEERQETPGEAYNRTVPRPRAINGAVPNDSGVYPKDKAEHLGHATKKASADIYALETEAGWIVSGNYDHRTGTMSGMGTPLSAHEPFPTRAEAIKAAAQEILRANRRITEEKGQATETQIQEAKKIVQWATDVIKQAESGGAAPNPAAKKGKPTLGDKIRETDEYNAKVKAFNDELRRIGSSMKVGDRVTLYNRDGREPAGVLIGFKDEEGRKLPVIKLDDGGESVEMFPNIRPEGTPQLDRNKYFGAPAKESHPATTGPRTAENVSREEIGDRPGASKPVTIEGLVSDALLKMMEGIDAPKTRADLLAKANEAYPSLHQKLPEIVDNLIKSGGVKFADSPAEEIQTGAAEAKAGRKVSAKELEQRGVEPVDKLDAERRFSNGERIFAAHEADEVPFEIKNIEDLRGYSPDQLIALPKEQSPLMGVVDSMVEHIKAGTLTKQIAAELLAKHHGGTMAQGKFTAKDMTDVMEMAVNKLVMTAKKGDRPLYDIGSNVERAIETVLALKEMVNKLPTQTTRSGEMDQLQQFSTPPHLGYVANWVANLTSGDVVLEPSAGVGGLAAFPKSIDATVIGNELSQRRADLLRKLEMAHKVTQHNAEHLNALMKPEIAKGEIPQPTAVVMNPPFSNAAKSGKSNTLIGAQHVEEALKLLPPGGRLVAIVGEGMASDRPAFRSWWQRMAKQYNVRANIGVSGEEYRKYGTTFGNQILVIDKTGPTPVASTVTGHVDRVEDLISRLAQIRNDRPTIEQTSAESGGAQATTPSEGRIGAATDESTESGAPGAGGGRGAGGPAIVAGEGVDRLGGESDASGRSTPAPGGESVPAGRVEPPTGERGGPGSVVPQGSIAGVSVQKRKEGQRELTEHGVFSEYSPQKVKVEGSKSHPTPLVEPTAMASVAPVDPDYSPKLPPELISGGGLSDAQLENVIYAGQAHSTVMPNGERMGYFIGDGTGVGKGRQIASIILDNWNQGRKRALWVSKSKGLIRDAARDLQDVGMDPTKLIDLSKNKGAALKAAADGIAFVPYSSLRTGNPGLNPASVTANKPKLLPVAPDKQTRLHLLEKWMGKDFDGVIVFDEAHQAGNAVDIKTDRGVKEASAQGLAVLDVQKLFPKARVLYASATGATDVTNLSYADRLGIWGPGTPFSNKQAFFEQIQSGGLSAMEIVARDLKSMGRYMARTLSFEGVTRRQLVHKLTPEQTKLYDDLGEAWQYVLEHRNESMAMTGASKNGRARSAANSAFYGAQQRFYNQLLTAMQMPSVIEDARRMREAGNSILFQVVNTNEATLGREIAEKSGKKAGEEAGEDGNYLEDLDLSPRDILLQYIDSSYPTTKYEAVMDAEGNVRYVEVRDKDGNPVADPEAVARKQELMDKMALIKAPSNPLEMILDTFGVENVAEITGRTKRVVNKEQPDGTRKRVLETNRKDATRKVEAAEYQDGKRRFLIFSDAGGTGFSYHASRKAKNQDRRIHYLIQSGWRADTAMQGFGRSHRSDQASAPEYVLASTDIKGHQRFMSTIARRLSELGALTGGERKSAGGELFSDENNLENAYAENAVTKLFTDLHRGTVEGFKFDDISKKLGFTKTVMDERSGEMQTINTLIDPKTGGLNVSKIPTIQQFLNRVLALGVNEQNGFFDAFMDRMQNRIAAAKEDGTYDPGTQTLKALSVKKLSDEVVYQHPSSTAKTRLVEVEHEQPVTVNQWKDVNKIGGLSEPVAYVQSIRNGKVYALKPGPNRTLKNGAVTETWRRISVTGADIVPQGDIQVKALYGEEPNYKRVEPEDAQAMWNDQAEKAPKTKNYRDTYLTGAFLPIWDRVKIPDPKIWRVTTNDRETFLGAHVPPKMVEDLRARLGAGSGAADTPQSVFSNVLDRNIPVELANGWNIKRSRVAGENRIEVTGLSYDQMKEFTNFLGGYMERIQYTPRFFLPTDEGAGIAALEKILKKSPPLKQKPGEENTKKIIGMGFALPEELSMPTIEEQISGKLAPKREAAEEEPMPTPEKSETLKNVGELFNQVKGAVQDWVGTVAGKTFPRTTRRNRKAGELGARWVSSPIAAKRKAEVFAAEVLGDTGIDPVEFGGALTEDNLRSIKGAFQEKADEAFNRDEIVYDLKVERDNLKEMDTEDPAIRKDIQKLNREIERISKLTDEDGKAAQAQADAVKSFVGVKGFPFKTEEGYQAFLEDKKTKEALARHRDLWGSVIEPDYRAAMGIDPEMELPSRGAQTSARINLFAHREGEPARNVVSTAARGNLLGTLRRKSPFGVRAKGTGEAYHMDYYDVIQNTFNRQLEIANKNAFENELVDAGYARIDDPGKDVTIRGKEVPKHAQFPLRRQRLITPQGTFHQNKTLYVDPDIAGEYRIGANVDANPALSSRLLRTIASPLNKAALTGFTDAFVHVTNLGSALATLPGNSGKLLHDSLLSALPGRPDVWLTVTKAIANGFKDNRAQLASLAEIGALRQSELKMKAKNPLSWRHIGSDVIHAVDLATRLSLDNSYKELAKQGLVENSETARREFVNQVGQYNKRAQGAIKRWFRDTGLGPFVTAGTTFNTLGVRAATLNPGVKASSKSAAIALKANMLAKLAGTIGTIATLNYLLTKDKGGGAMGRPGIPLGAIDMGTNDKNGRPQYMSILSLVGPGRGFRVTGARGLVQGLHNGLPVGVALDSAASDIINSAIHPLAGPAVRFGSLSATGYEPARGIGRALPVVPPGKNQFMADVKHAVVEASPLVSGIHKATQPGSTGLSEIAKSQFPRLTMQPGKPAEMMRDYPGIVRRAQANGFIDDVIGRARKMEPKERLAYLRKAIDQLEDPRDKKKAIEQFRYRRVL